MELSRGTKLLSLYRTNLYLYLYIGTKSLYLYIYDVAKPLSAYRNSQVVHQEEEVHDKEEVEQAVML